MRRRIGPFAPWEAGYAFDAPVPAAGEVTGPPDFVGVGVQRAGTSWWFSLLVAHPQVHHRRDLHKERHYFTRYATTRFDEDAARGYARWFPRPPGTVTGEWTPDYVHEQWVLPLLARAAPRARIFLLLRDPVERLLSGLAHESIEPSTNLGSRLADAVGRGRYADALRRVRAAFPDEQVLAVQYEACVANPRARLEEAYRFLGVDAGFVPDRIGRPVSASANVKAPLDPEARARLADFYREDVSALGELVPGFDAGLWPNFALR